MPANTIASHRTRRPAGPVPSDELGRILAGSMIVSHFQPIIDLGTMALVGHEALARGPAGSDLAQPDALFAAAAASGRTAALDAACRSAALRGFTEAEARGVLFMNIEPSSLPSVVRDPAIAAFASSGQLVIELTERALADRPTELLGATDRLRSMGARIAIDDVGTHDASLALMPFLRPDVIKIDKSLIQDRVTPAVASDLAAVLGEAEHSGAAILAEGVETDRHEARAIALGARFGQGWRYGRPAPRPSALMGAVDMPRLGNLAAGATPVDIAFAARTDRIASKLDLLGFSRHLEHWAAESSERPVVLATFQTADRFPPATRSWYADLATTCSFVGAMGRGMAASPAPGVRGWSLSDNEALVGQWNVLVVGRHIAGALIALDLNDPDGTPDAERRFRFVITYDRALVVEAARALMARVVAVPLES